MEKLYIIAPAYNEQENIERFVGDWYPVIEKRSEDSRLVIINDGSKDNTYEILLKLAADRPKLLPLTKPNGGHGATLLYGYRYAIESGAEYIFQTDSDGQTDPAEFPQFWNNRDRYDAVIGNRVKRGDGRSRKFVEWTVCFLLRLIFGVKVPDANAPFRLMKASLVAKYIDKLPMDFNIPNIMFTAYFAYHKEKVLFLPITFKPRQAGKNSINIKKIVRIGWKAVGDFFELKRDIEIRVGDGYEI